MTDWVRLNVGGTMFETTRTTLISDRDSILAKMFDPDSDRAAASVSQALCKMLLYKAVLSEPP